MDCIEKNSLRSHKKEMRMLRLLRKLLIYVTCPAFVWLVVYISCYYAEDTGIPEELM